MSSETPPSGSSAAVAYGEPVGSPAVERPRGRGLLIRIATDRELLLIVLIVTLIALMTILEPTTFPRAANAAVILLDTAQTGILACGMMVLLISGMFDLSIGGILGFSGIMAGLAAKNLGLPPIVAFLVGCGWGMLLGAVNGVLVTRFKINALIATLATLSIYRGLLQLVSGAGVTNIGNGFTVFGQTQILGIYSPFWFMAVIVVLFAFLVGRTRYFRQAYYIGGNARAAKLSGINVDRTVFSFFVIMGLLAGLAGALLASRLNTAVVLAGQGVELKVITAVVLGGASLSGGVGTIFGAFLGVLLMALLQNAMIIAGINPFWQLIVVGIVLLISVGLDQFARARSPRLMVAVRPLRRRCAEGRRREKGRRHETRTASGALVLAALLASPTRRPAPKGPPGLMCRSATRAAATRSTSGSATPRTCRCSSSGSIRAWSRRARR